MLIFRNLPFAITIRFEVYVRSVHVKTQSQLKLKLKLKLEPKLIYLQVYTSFHLMERYQNSCYARSVFHMEASSVRDMSDLRNTALKPMFRDPMATLPYLLGS